LIAREDRALMNVMRNMRHRSYYMVLGVSPWESSRGIRQAFRELANRYHPDRIGPERLHFFQEILQAYRILTDPERRSQYDQGVSYTGAKGGAPQTPVSSSVENRGDLPRPIPTLRVISINDLPFEAALALVSVSLTSAERVSKEHPKPLNARVILTSDEAVQGGAIFIAVPSCSPCERCGGSGREGLFSCRRCDGEGLIEEEEMVRVQIPPMIGDGTLMEVPLRGLGVHNFYLRLHIRVAPEREREISASQATGAPSFNDRSDPGTTISP
jgi:molecular chaperone DnaJ